MNDAILAFCNLVAEKRLEEIEKEDEDVPKDTTYLNTEGNPFKK